MNLNDAINNLNQVLFVGRIEMPNGPLSAQEHQELAGNFNLLVARAQLADKLEQQIQEENKAKKEIPEVPGESQDNEGNTPADIEG